MHAGFSDGGKFAGLGQCWDLSGIIKVLDEKRYILVAAW